ncbi:hypothetical protein HA402_008983, partial [Bradysia odoriphaga]
LSAGRKFENKEQWCKGAVKLYNKSIRFAESKELLSLAYANRSYCYMELQLFNQCLVDIEYAKEHYPDNLAAKLEKRKQTCVEKIKLQIEPNSDGQSLSYELPEIASDLNIEINEEYGRLNTANCDINVGDTLLAYIRSSTGDECVNCGKTKSNLIPCNNCVDAMYCGKVCADNDFHAIECNKTLDSNDLSHASSGHFILRSIIVGTNSFTTIDEMIEFINNIQLTDSNEIGQYDTPVLKYRSFFKLSTFITDQWMKDFRNQATLIYHAIMSSTQYAAKFDTQQKQRFLVALIFYHAAIIRSNAFGGFCEPPDQFSQNINEPVDFNEHYERSIYLVASYFNHSCLPNVTKLSKGNLAVITAIQPIKSGQQLFVTYLAGDLIERTSIDRNDELTSGYGFQCKCELCVNGVQIKARILERDGDFLYVACNIKGYRILISEIKEHCIKFIQNHSNNLASEPGYFILNTLTAMLQKELDC